MARPGAMDRLRKSKKSTYRRVSICLDTKYESAHREAIAALEKAERKFTGRAPNAGERQELDELRVVIEEAKEALDENSIAFHVKSLGPKSYDQLVSDHPATDAQRKEAKKMGGGLSFNIETFPRALVQACASVVDEDDDGEEVLVPLDDEMVAWMFESDDWSAGELGKITNTCYEVNLGLRNVAALGNG